MTPRLAIIGCAAVAVVGLIASGLVHTPSESSTTQAGARIIPARRPEAPRPQRSHRRRRIRREYGALRRDGQLPAHKLFTLRRQAIKATRAFLTAYLRLEVGHITPARRRKVQKSATPRLARRVLGGPVRVPAVANGAPPPGEIVGIAGEFDKPPSTFGARVLIDRTGTVSELGLIVRRTGDRWLVDDLTE